MDMPCVRGGPAAVVEEPLVGQETIVPKNDDNSAGKQTICERPIEAESRLATLRILDANLNRATEGLRVIEDYCRFALDDRHLTQRCKQLRHDLVTILGAVSTPILTA